MDVPQTGYARSGDLQIAYQVVGERPLDIVFVPAFATSVEAIWGLPRAASFLKRLASFSRLILFDRRGTGMSDGTRGVASLEEQIDDVRAVMNATACDHPAFISQSEGCALAALFAASNPSLVRALVMMVPTARMVRAAGYEWAPSIEERAVRVEMIVKFWGSESPQNPWMSLLGPGESDDEQLRRAVARLQRMSLSPAAAAAAQAIAGEVDVRHVLPSIQCPTLVLRRAGETIWDERHALYVAEHIPDSRYVELPGEGPVWVDPSHEDDWYRRGSRLGR